MASMRVSGLGKCAAVLVLAAAPFWVSPAAAADDPPEETININDRAAVEELVRRYILEHPEVIIESVQRFEKRKQEAERAHQRAILASLRDDIENSPTSPVTGNPEGDVTVVEFFDYRCGYCKRVLPAIQELLRTDGGVRYVFKEFPILGPDSVVAARAAVAAWKIDPEKYVAFHTDLMASRGALSEQRVLDMAQRIGFDPEQLLRAMEDPAVDAELQGNIALGGRIGVRGTPAFIIGGRLVPGAIDLEQMRRLIAAARQS